MKNKLIILDRELTVEDLSFIVQNLADRLSCLESANTSHHPLREAEPIRRTIGPYEAARMLGLSRSRVYVLSSQGKIPVHKVGNRLLFFPDDLEKYIRSGGSMGQQGNKILNKKKADAL